MEEFDHSVMRSKGINTMVNQGNQAREEQKDEVDTAKKLEQLFENDL